MSLGRTRRGVRNDPVLVLAGGMAPFWQEDYARNPILEPTEAWEGISVERMVVLADDVDPTILRGWFTANVTGGGYDDSIERIGFAMSATRQHYPMWATYDSPVHDNTSQRTGCTVTFGRLDATHFSGPAGTSTLLQYRSSATSAADCKAQAWTTWTSGSVTLERYAQFRVHLRTLAPYVTPQVSQVKFAKSGFTWTTNDKTTFDSGAYGFGCFWEDPNFSALTLKPVIPAYGWTKYWTNPVISENAAPGWRSAGVSAGGVLKIGGVYKMWFNGQYAGWKLGYATSADGIAWTIGNGDAPLDFWSEGTVIADSADPTVLYETGAYHIFFPSQKTSGYYQLHYSQSADGITGWTTPVVIYDAPVDNPALPTAGSAVACCVIKIGSLYHVFWEESNALAPMWRIMHGTFAVKGLRVTGVSTAVTESNQVGDWREIGAATPWFIWDGQRLIGFIKGFNGSEANTASGYVPDHASDQAQVRRLLPLRAQCVRVPVTASDTYAGVGLSLLIPGRSFLRAIVIDVGEATGFVTGTSVVSGAHTVQVAVGSGQNTDGTLSGAEIDALVASALAADTPGVHGTLSADYASGYMNGPGSGRYFATDTTLYLNVIAKAGTVSGSDVREVRVPIRAYGIFDESFGPR